MLRNKPIVPGGRTIIVIGYKYKAHKVLSFIVTDNAGIKESGIPYLSKHNVQFSNFSICPVARPPSIYKFFGSINEVDSKKKSRQPNLAL